MAFMIGDIVRSDKFGKQGVVQDVRCQWVHGHNLEVIDFEDDGDWLGHHFHLVKRPIINRIKRLINKE